MHIRVHVRIRARELAQDRAAAVADRQSAVGRALCPALRTVTGEERHTACHQLAIEITRALGLPCWHPAGQPRKIQAQATKMSLGRPHHTLLTGKGSSADVTSCGRRGLGTLPSKYQDYSLYFSRCPGFTGRDEQALGVEHGGLAVSCRCLVAPFSGAAAPRGSVRQRRQGGRFPGATPSACLEVRERQTSSPVISRAQCPPI